MDSPRNIPYASTTLANFAEFGEGEACECFNALQDGVIEALKTC
jgi:hypothetical protein